MLADAALCGSDATRCGSNATRSDATCSDAARCGSDFMLADAAHYGSDAANCGSDFMLADAARCGSDAAICGLDFMLAARPAAARTPPAAAGNRCMKMMPQLVVYRLAQNHKVICPWVTYLGESAGEPDI